MGTESIDATDGRDATSGAARPAASDGARERPPSCPCAAAPAETGAANGSRITSRSIADAEAAFASGSWSDVGAGTGAACGSTDATGGATSSEGGGADTPPNRSGDGGGGAGTATGIGDTAVDECGAGASCRNAPA